MGRTPNRAEPEALAAERQALATEVAEAIFQAVVSAPPPGKLYGLALGYLDGEVGAYVWPLYELTRRWFIERGYLPEHAQSLWDATALDEDELPDGVPFERPDRMIEVPQLRAPDFGDHYWWASLGPHPDPNAALTGEQIEAQTVAMERLWTTVMDLLNQREWPIDVTDDFVVVAHDPEGVNLRDQLRHALGERIGEFEARGFIP